MKRRLGLSVLGALAGFTMTIAMAATAPPAKVGHTSKGATLVDDQGMTLYNFAKDKHGKSACNGPCATKWPPLKAESGAKPGKGYTVVKRADGSLQWAHKGKPLYTWSGDKKPGDTTGDGFLNGAWRVARP